jgi:flagellar hook assembly protein FlgD
MKAMQAGEEVKVTMVYHLTTPADISIYLYGPEGRVVWGRRFAAGTMGGLAGYNAVSWDGRDMSGQVVGNGLYVFKIISGTRAIGQGVIVVLD